MYYGFHYYDYFTKYNCIGSRKTCNDIGSTEYFGSLYSPLVV